jgi:hypothetical protein
MFNWNKKFKIMNECLIENENGNFANTLLGAGYSSCEVCFNVKLKRKGIMKWLEDKKIIKSKTEGFALMVRDWDDVIVMSSAEPHGGVVSITSTKVNGLR